MKILHTTSSLDPAAGGPARSVPQIALAQAELGHQVSIWVNDASHLAFADEILNHKAVTICCGPLLALIGNGNGNGFSVVHDHGIWELFHCRVAWLCQRFSLPRVVSPRGMLEPWSMGHKKWKKRVAWYLYQKRNLMQADTLHATSAAEAKQFKHLGLNNEVLIQPNGVSLPLGAAVPGEAVLRASGTAARKMLFVGRIHPQKGLPLAVEAWSKVVPKDWEMYVVGPDEKGHEAELKGLIRKRGFETEWVFKGPMQGIDKWRVFYEADVVILPTYSENFGITVAESLATGTPVITTTGTPWAGLIERNCGWWVEPNVESIARAMGEAMSLDVDVLKKMGDQGREWVERDFSWPVIASEIIKGYEAVIEE
jgi:glycosyltransferase involved in cell wall biosynthesis